MDRLKALAALRECPNHGRNGRRHRRVAPRVPGHGQNGVETAMGGPGVAVDSGSDGKIWG